MNFITTGKELPLPLKGQIDSLCLIFSSNESNFGHTGALLNQVAASSWDVVIDCRVWRSGAEVGLEEGCFRLAPTEQSYTPLAKFWIGRGGRGNFLKD